MTALSRQFLRSVTLKTDQIPSFTVYPFCIPAIRNLARLDLHAHMTILIGENGTGKSTILEAMAVAAGLNPEGGSRNASFHTKETHSALHNHLIVARGTARPSDSYSLRAESFYNLASWLDDLPGGNLSHGGTSLHQQSHGESFWALLSHRFGGRGLYFLDEPEAALSPSRQLAALARIHQLIGQGAQFIMATHSPILMAYPNACLYLLSEDGIQKIDYKDTEHYQISRNFLNHVDASLEELLRDPSD